MSVAAVRSRSLGPFASQAIVRSRSPAATMPSSLPSSSATGRLLCAQSQTA